MPKRTLVTLSQDAPASTRPRRASTKKKKLPFYGMVVGTPRPFPTRTVGTLKYAETIYVSNALTAISTTWMRANGIYDPNPLVGGHQPYGHDTYATIYNQYTVLRSKITVIPGQVTGVLNPMTFGLGISDDASTSASFDTWMERPGYKATRMLNNAGPAAVPLTMIWDRNKRFPKQDTYQTLSAPFGADPAEVEYFEIPTQSYNSGIALGQIYLSITIEYTCEFYELKDLGNS